MSRCLNFSFLVKDKEFPNADEAPIDDLPNELLIEIFRRLPVEELIRCAGVCRRWRKLTKDPNLWRCMPVVCSAQLGDIGERKEKLIEYYGKYIRCIKVQYILNYPVIKNVIEKCDNLISVEFIMCRMEKEFENDIKKWHQLYKLNLRNSLLRSETDLQIQYDQFTKLNFLGLSDFGLSAVNCESLLRCRYLNFINIEKIRGLTLEFIKRLVATKEATLASLRLYGADAVDDDVLRMLAKCPKLQELAIIRCENLTDKSLVAISTYEKLHTLQLWNNITFTEYRLLTTLSHSNMIKLKSLSLSRVQNVSTKIVDVISEYYKNIRFLALYQCPQITDTDYEKQLRMKFRNIDVVLY